MLTSDQIADLENLKSLSTHIVSILDNEARIDTTLRQLTPTNVTALNDAYANVVEVIDQIVQTQLGLP